MDWNEWWPHRYALRVESLAVVCCRGCEPKCARVAQSKQSPHAIQQPLWTRPARMHPIQRKECPCAATLFLMPILAGPAVMFREKLTASKPGNRSPYL